MPSHIISVDAEQCVGCGICTSVCHKNQGNELSGSNRRAIELKGGIAKVSLFDCTRCRRCILYCPTGSIKLQKT